MCVYGCIYICTCIRTYVQCSRLKAIFGYSGAFLSLLTRCVNCCRLKLFSIALKTNKANFVCGPPQFQIQERPIEISINLEMIKLQLVRSDTKAIRNPDKNE